MTALSGAALRGSGTSGPGLPTGFPWSTEKKPKNASWNIFLDAISAAQVWAFGLEIVLVPDSAFEHLQVEPTDPNAFVPQNCTNKLLSDIVIYWAPSQNQTWSGLRYWDQATAVVVMQRLLGKESVCQNWMKSGIMVSLQNDASYATYLQGSAGARSEAAYPRALFCLRLTNGKTHVWHCKDNTEVPATRASTPEPNRSLNISCLTVYDFVLAPPSVSKWTPRQVSLCLCAGLPGNIEDCFSPRLLQRRMRIMAGSSEIHMRSLAPYVEFNLPARAS